MLQKQNFEARGDNTHQQSHPRRQRQVVSVIFFTFFISQGLCQRNKAKAVLAQETKKKAILIEPLSHKLRGSLWEICHVQRSQPLLKSPNNKTLISFGDTERYQRAYKEIRWCVWDDVHLTQPVMLSPTPVLLNSSMLWTLPICWVYNMYSSRHPALFKWEDTGRGQKQSWCFLKSETIDMTFTWNKLCPSI